MNMNRGTPKTTFDMYNTNKLKTARIMLPLILGFIIGLIVGEVDADYTAKHPPYRVPHDHP